MTNPNVKDAVGNIAALEYAGSVKAIFCLMIDKDGDIVTESSIPQELKYQMIAAIQIIHHDLIKHVLDTGKTQKDRDI